MEDDFLEALVASERIAEWVASIKRSSSLDGERKQAAVRLALAQMLQQVSQSQVYAEEAVLANVDKELAQLVDDNDKVWHWTGCTREREREREKPANVKLHSFTIISERTEPPITIRILMMPTPLSNSCRSLPSCSTSCSPL